MSRESGEFKVNCAYCNALHYSASCQSVTDPAKRKEILSQAKRCCNCLRQGHGVKDCRSPRLCRNCASRHHRFIFSKGYIPHDSPERPNDSKDKDEETKTEGRTNCTITAGSQIANRKHVLLQTARTIATNVDGSNTSTVRILFDSGIQRSYITDDLRRKLRLNAIKTETLHLHTFGDNKHQRKSCQVFDLVLRSRANDETQISVLNFPVICSPLPASVDILDYPHIRELDLADFVEGQGSQHDTIDVLICSDYYWNFVTGETARGDSGPVAINSVFGWMLSGKVELTKRRGARGETTTQNLVISSNEDFIMNDNNQRDDQLVEELKGFWELETIGIKGPSQVDDCTANEGFIEDIAFDGKNYEVALPWKGGRFPEPDGYNTFYNCLQSLHRKLRADPALLKEYDKIIRQQLEGGIIEQVRSTKQPAESGNRVNYLPHHPVIRGDKDTTKACVVYDGSAKNSKEEKSLNDCLEIGPNYTPHVFDTAYFRWNSIGVTADIEKAFLRIGIKSSDRDALRFLWFDDPNECHPELTVYRFERLVFGLRPSPAILGFTISHHLDQYLQSDSKLVSLLKESFYVDDFVTGEESVKQSFHIYKRSKEIMEDVGFNLRKWNTNSQALRDKIEVHELSHEATTNDKSTQEHVSHSIVPAHTSEEDESYAKLTTGNNATDPSNNSVAVLGSNWDTKTDELFFNFDK